MYVLMTTNIVNNKSDGISLDHIFSTRNDAIDYMRNYLYFYLEHKVGIVANPIYGIPELPAYMGTSEYNFTKEQNGQRCSVRFSPIKGQLSVETIDISNTANASSSCFIASIEEHPTLKAPPEYDHVLEVCINVCPAPYGPRRKRRYMTWRIPLTTEEAAPLAVLNTDIRDKPAQEAAKTLLRQKIQPILASEEGWKRVKAQNNDFTWSDIFDENNSFIPMMLGHTKEHRKTKNTIQTGVIVYENESLVPTNIPVGFRGIYDDGTVYNDQAVWNMANNTISLDKDLDEKTLQTFTDAFIVPANGDRLACDPKENYLRLI